MCLYLTDIVLLVLQLISLLLLLFSASVLFPILVKPTMLKLNERAVLIKDHLEEINKDITTY